MPSTPASLPPSSRGSPRARSPVPAGEGFSSSTGRETAVRGSSTSSSPCPAQASAGRPRRWRRATAAARRGRGSRRPGGAPRRAPPGAGPGAPPGPPPAPRLYGTVPWERLFDPAIELARNGVELNRQQAYLHAIPDGILSPTEPGRAIYSPDGERLTAGGRLVMRDLAGTLELLATEGADALYGGPLGRTLSEYVQAEGG